MLKKKVDENIEVEKLTNRQIIKAWIANAAQDLKNSLKHGGWRGAAAGFAVAGVGMTFVACEVEKVNVQITEVGSLDQIQTMLGENFSVSEQIKTAAAQKFGNNLVSLMSENANGTGKVVAIFVEDGILKKATTELDLTAKDFDGKIYAYNTYLKEGNTLSFYQNGQEQEVDLSKPGIVSIPQADGSLAVLDTTKAEEKIEKAILSVQQTEFDLQTDLDEVGKQDFKTLLGFVIEKDQPAHLPTLSLEYDRAKNQTTATYSYLSLAGQTKIESGSIVFEGDVTANGNLDRAAAEEQLQAEKATISKKTPTVLEQSDLTKLYQVENFDTNSVELEVAEKDSGGEVNPPDEPELEPITFGSWQEVFELENGKVKDAIVKTLQDNLLQDSVVKMIFGNTTSVADLSNGTINLIKWGFDVQDNQISSISLLGVRKGYPTEQSRRLRGADFAFQTPISLDGIVAMPVLEGSANAENSISIFINGVEYSIDLTFIVDSAKAATCLPDFVYESMVELTEEQEQFFNICMPLAVAAGKIGQESKLSFVSVQGAGGSNDKFGSTYGVTITAVDLNSNQLYNLRFIFDDTTDPSKTPYERVVEAITRKEFLVFDNGQEQIMPNSDIMLEYQTDITEYAIPQAEAEETN